MLLELKNITTGYSSPVTEHGSATLRQGEVCLIIGNNGAGKTTLIKSILNQTSLLSGKIFLSGHDVKDLSPKQIAEKIAVVFSKTSVPPNFTVRDLVSLGKFIHYPYYFELSQSDKLEVERIISDLGLNDYKNTFLSRLSDGNLQKAFIGRALAQNSPIIILDEPTTHLDEENKLMILKLLRQLSREQKKLILFSSHDWRISKEFSDQIWYLNNQQLYAGLAEEILLQHRDLLSSKIINVSPAFVAPEISAPALEKEMLYSYLQKNVERDISTYHFTWSASFWEVKGPNTDGKFTSFKELGDILSILL